MRGLVVVFVAAAVVATGLGDGTARGSHGEQASGSTVGWGSCAGYGDARLVELGLECAKIEIPLDHAQPDGDKLTIALNRIRATAPSAQRQGVLLINPGGPGGSGLSWAPRIHSYLPREVAARYDVIGFDPRGIGASEPAMSCDPEIHQPVMPDPVPASEQEERAWLQRAKDYADACAAKYPDLLKHMKTTDVARDMDLIRRALGERQINYFGYSYGTWLGANYATLFPDRVRRFALDSSVRPSGMKYGIAIDAEYAWGKRLKRFFAWVARHDTVWRLGDDPDRVEELWYETRAALKKDPAQDLVGPYEFEAVFIPGMYDTTVWPDVAEAWSAYVLDGNGEPLVQASTTEADDNAYAAYNAVGCTDAVWPKWPTWRRDAIRVHAQAPFVAWRNAWFNSPCLFWPETGEATQINGAGLPGILLIHATHDAVTLYEGALEMHQLLPSSRLLVESGGLSHGVLGEGNACIDRKIGEYLDSGELPPGRHGPDDYCPGLPEPPPEDDPANQLAALMSIGG